MVVVVLRLHWCSAPPAHNIVSDHNLFQLHSNANVDGELQRHTVYGNALP